MALCEVVNSNAFSTSTSESETRRSNFEVACNKALEAGYHVAFSTNQDNHCANWGMSYTNRTGVLLPAGDPLDQRELHRRPQGAPRVRHHGQGLAAGADRERPHDGRTLRQQRPLALVAHFASGLGKAVSSVVMFEGVPGRKARSANCRARRSPPSRRPPGEHFYYVRVTQEDGNMLWSAPVWVSQQ